MLTDAELAQKISDLNNLHRLIAERTAEGADTAALAELEHDAAELAEEIADENELRKEHPGTVIQFPSPRPTDQGSC